MNTVDSGAKPSTIAGDVVRADGMSAPHRTWARSILGVVLVIAAACILLFATYVRNRSDNVPAAEAASQPAAPSAPALVSTAADKKAWTYSMERDAAGPAERVGCVQSLGTVFLGEPYDSEHASLCFRSDGMAYLKLNGDGRISTGAGYDVTVRIGDGPLRKLETVKPGDQSMGVAILTPADSLFAAARTGKPITVTATYDEDLEQSLTFAPQEPLKLNN